MLIFVDVPGGCDVVSLERQAWPLQCDMRDNRTNPYQIIEVDQLFAEFTALDVTWNSNCALSSHSWN